MILHVALAVASTVAQAALPPAPAPVLPLPLPLPLALPLVATKPVHHFYDRPARLELAAAVTVAAMDMRMTCHNLAIGGHEDFLTQSCPANVGITAGILLAQELLAWTLHRHGHHRLERLARLASTVDSAGGLIYSKQRRSW